MVQTNKTSKQKILIVDDSKGWLDYHVSALRQIFEDKYELETANSGREGYEKALGNISSPYSLIISDLQMEYDFEPQYAGEWLVEMILKLKEYKNTPITIISACYNIKYIAERLGVNYLSKAVAARDLTSYKFAMEELLN